MINQERTYEIVINGKSPLIMHHDNIVWADDMDAWKANPANKKISRAGDDRTPAWRWIGALYHDGEHVTMQVDNIMRCLMEGGAMVPVPGAKGNKTFKSQTQSGIAPCEGHWKLETQLGLIPVAEIDALKRVDDFKKHLEATRAMGFDLLVKRAKVGMAKHIRVRPIFHNWQLVGHLRVRDEQITTEVLQDILSYAGQYKGLGDWRPGGKTPGTYGMFTAEVRETQ